jgi:hypothetical protein
MISKANSCIDMFKRDSSAAAPKAFTLPSPDAFKTVSSFQEFLRHPVAIEYFRYLVKKIGQILRLKKVLSIGACRRKFELLDGSSKL